MSKVKIVRISHCGECPYRIGPICKFLRDMYGYNDIIKVNPDILSPNCPIVEEQE